MKVSAVVLAAGAGRRFRTAKFSHSRLSKVFHPLGGRFMVSYSLDLFASFKQIREIILVVPPRLIPWVKRKFLGSHVYSKTVRVVGGGKERSDSSWAGFRKVSKHATHVLIHDAARPLLSRRSLTKLFHSLGTFDGAILGKRITPTIKWVDEKMNICRTVPRSGLWEAETPQIFRRQLLEGAFKLYKAAPLRVSDDAGLCEQTGARIKMVENPAPNFKITTQADRILAEKFLSNGLKERRGIGFDIHRLLPRRKLMLGGIKISNKVGALGHSDGDALLHAVTDALLGAAGLGDIGQWFPDSDPRYRGISSVKLIERVLKEIKQRGLKPVHLDTTIHLERPKLGKYRARIRKNVARLLSLQIQHVNIKAKTGEGLGSIGKCKAVRADAIVTVEETHG